MNATRLTSLLFLLCMALGIHAKKKHAEYPHADIKVAYNYHKKSMRGSDGIVERDIPFILLANNNESKFYSPKTEYMDSLQSTSSGKAINDAMLHEAIRKYSETKDRAVMDNVTYKTQLYVFKSKPDNSYNVYDYVGMTGHYTYTEPLEEIIWEVSDSTKSILDYECIMATADYHGRKWTAWFTSEIPVQEGPWKLFGLPGLILETYEASGQHHFLATGVENSRQEIRPVYNPKRYDKTSRIEMLRMSRNAKENGSAMMNAQLDLNLPPDKPMTEELKKYDFLETDYH